MNKYLDGVLVFILRLFFFGLVKVPYKMESAAVILEVPSFESITVINSNLLNLFSFDYY